MKLFILPHLINKFRNYLFTLRNTRHPVTAYFIACRIKHCCTRGYNKLHIIPLTGTPENKKDKQPYCVCLSFKVVLS